MEIFVAGLPWAVDKERLKDIFAEFGKVTWSKVIYERETQKSRGIGFVCMVDSDEALNAIKCLNGSVVDGRKLFVDVAKPRESRADS